MASTIVEPVADALKTQILAISYSPAIRVSRWAPRRIESTPAAVIDVPSVDRVAPREAEFEMGREDWRMTFGVSFYFKLSDAEVAQSRAVEFFELFVSRIDDHPTLGLAGVDDAKVTSSEADITLVEEATPLFAYRCTVELIVQVAQ